MDVKKHEVTVEGQGIALTLKEFELLKRLMTNRNIVLTRAGTERNGKFLTSTGKQK